MFENFSTIISLGFLIIGVLSFIVSVITEVIKDTMLFKKVPTDILVIVISLTLSVLLYFTLCNYYDKRILWYEVFGSFIGGFFVAFISMYGWDKFNKLLLRFKTFRKKQ